MKKNSKIQPSSVSLICVSSLLMVAASHAATIDIVGSTTLGGGGDFGDYSGLSAGNNIQNWLASTVDDGVVGLSVGDTGVNADNSTSGFNNAGSYRGAGTEINFTVGGDSATTAAAAISANQFLSFQLDSTAFASDSFTFDSISVSMWRNGGAAAQSYQFAFDDEGDGTWAVDDLLGSETTNTVSGTTNTFSVSETITSTASTQQEVRLYFWNGTIEAANTHLFDVEATYSAVPEPSAFAVIIAGVVGCMAITRRRI